MPHLVSQDKRRNGYCMDDIVIRQRVRISATEQERRRRAMRQTVASGRMAHGRCGRTVHPRASACIYGPICFPAVISTLSSGEAMASARATPLRPALRPFPAPRRPPAHRPKTAARRQSRLPCNTPLETDFHRPQLTLLTDID